MTFRLSKPASLASLLQFEQKLGRTLPDEYRKFALEINGIVPEWPYIDSFFVQSIFPIDHAEHNPIEEKKIFPYELPESIYPFAIEGLGNYFLIDLDSGEILLWDHEGPEPEGGVLKHEDLFHIADGVEDFLSRLTA